VSRGRKAGGRGLILAGVFVGLLVATLFAAAFFLGSPGRPGAEALLFEVRKGETASSVADRLRAEGLIRSAFAFKLVARIEGVESRLKSGTYRLDPGQGALAVLERIASGRQVLEKATLPEGLTLRETAKILSDLGIVSAESFLASAKDPALLAELGIPGPSAEGYLFPDTYLMPKDFSAPAAVRMLVANFRARVEAISGASGLGAAELQRRVTLASVVEREYRVPDEAPLIASVFDNRLRIGMPLQSCATVVYVITEHLGKPHPDIVYDKDLKIPDAYNTYMNRGLPPGPIANPGMVALKAAFVPPKSPWLYFRLVDPEAGSHHFSTTLEEHLGAAQLVVKRAPGK
jgi:UPF0755 protein